MILIFLSLSLNLAKDPLGRDISGHNCCILSGKSLHIAVQATEGDKPLADKWIKFIPHNGKISQDSAKTDNAGFASIRFTPGEEGWVEAKTNGESIVIKPNVIPKQQLIKLILSVIIGIVLILMGLDHTNKGFSRLSGEKTKQMLWKMTKNPILAYLSGIILAVLFESSTLTGLMLLGLLESSLIKLSTALIVLSGASLGSTFTVQIIATDVIQFSPVIVLIGFILWQTKTKLSYIGRILLGFGLIFFSIWLIRDNMQPLRNIFTPDINPILLFFSSIILTFLFHSSAGVLGLMIAFVGVLDLSTVIPVVLGVNIGTSFSILLGSTRFSSSRDRAMGVGYVILKILFVGLSFYFIFLPKGFSVTARNIANLHSMVNIWGLILIPFCFPLAKFLNKIFGVERSKLKLDPLFLSSSTVAISKSYTVIRESMEITRIMFEDTLDVFKQNNDALRKIIISKDNIIDKNHEELVSYTSKLLGQELSNRESAKCVTILKISNEIEHIGDLISKNIMNYAEKKIKESYFFSKEGFHEIKKYHETILLNIKEVEAALSSMDRDIASDLLLGQKETEEKLKKFRENHINRLKEGKRESIDTSAIHLDLLNDFDRINYHIYNISKAIMGKL
ncbi:Na/Pi cotransporter family protein [candidate division WOR-3 bacterium]|nr:Na/Pi cotransporter family protein [candidate division WOR-3 bacterium]